MPFSFKRNVLAQNFVNTFYITSDQHDTVFNHVYITSDADLFEHCQHNYCATSKVNYFFYNYNAAVHFSLQVHFIDTPNFSGTKFELSTVDTIIGLGRKNRSPGSVCANITYMLVA